MSLGTPENSAIQKLSIIIIIISSSFSSASASSSFSSSSSSSSSAPLDRLQTSRLYNYVGLIVGLSRMSSQLCVTNRGDAGGHAVGSNQLVIAFECPVNRTGSPQDSSGQSAVGRW